MSIALGSSSGEKIERPGFVGGSAFVPASSAGDGDFRASLDPVGGGTTVEDDCSNSCSSSSIGRDSDDDDDDDEDGDDDGETEVQSSLKGPLDSINALEEVLPIRKGISKFYSGKSKSFTNLADVSSSTSIKDLAKPENPFNRKCRNVLARKLFCQNNQSYPSKSGSTGISKSATNTGCTTWAVSNIGANDKGEQISNSSSLSPSHRLPPLHPRHKNISSSGLSAAPPQWSSPCRSFSLSDLQCAATGGVSMSTLSSLATGHGNDGRELV